MKKLLAILLCVITVFCLAVPAMAEVSPTGEEIVKVIPIIIPGRKGNTIVAKKGNIVDVQADPNEGEFTSWTVYLSDGSKAIEGVHYKITKGTDTSSAITVECYTDLIVCANYDGVTTDPAIAVEEFKSQSQSEAPKTGDSLALYAIFVLLSGAAVVLSTKKCKA